PEDSLVLLDGGDDGFSFADRARHGLLAPDILARLGGGDGDECVPMRRGGDVDDVDVFSCEHFAEILVAFHLGTGSLDRVLQMLFVHVTNGEELAGSIDGFDMAHAHAADADDGAGQNFAGGRLAGASEDVTRHDREGGQRRDGGLEEGATSEAMTFVHMNADGVWSQHRRMRREIIQWSIHSFSTTC